jgi:long-chain fatty acid transport protein
MRLPVQLRAASTFVVAALVVAAFSLPRDAQAQGFGVYEHGTCAMGRAGASVAKPCSDGSALFYNPAGIAGNPGITLSGGLTVIAVGGDFVSDRTREAFDIESAPIPVPHLYAAYGLNEDFSVGLGVFVPYGLGTEWDPDFPGRFLGYDNSLQSVYVQPTLAYRLSDMIRIGMGLDITFASVEINQRVDLAGVTVPTQAFSFSAIGVPTGTDFADATLEGHGVGIGGHFGIIFDVNDRVSIGARYLTAQEIDYDGEATFDAIATNLTLAGGNPLNLPAGTPLDALLATQFAQNGLLRTQDIETSITMPAQVVAGVAISPIDDLTIFADYQWTGWSVFDEVILDAEEAALQQIIEEEYDDTNGFRVGFEAVLGPVLTARAGYLYHDAAAPPQTVTPLLPEGERNEFTLGLGARITPTFTVDAAYQYIAQNDRRGRVTEPHTDDFDPIRDNDGLFSFDAHLFALTASLRLR